MIIVIIIIGFIIFVLWNVFFSVKLRLQTVNFYSGGLGSGKTLKATDTAIKLRNKSKIAHYLTFKKRPIREIYSNFPILLKGKKKNLKRYYKDLEKGKEVEPKNYKLKFSKILTKEHILGIERLPERVIVVLDEASSVFPNQMRKSDESITYAFRWFRHFTDGTLILCDQSIGDIDIAIRRRVNIVYNFSGFRKIPFLCYWIDVNRINYMEDVITNVNDVNNFENSRIFGFFGRRKFSSRYMKKFYNPMRENIKNWNDLVIIPENKENGTEVAKG